MQTVNPQVRRGIDEMYPPKQRRPKREWKPTKAHRAVLEAFGRHAERDDREILSRVVGDERVGTCIRCIEELAVHGYLQDTGKRSNNRLEGKRCIVWRITPQGRSFA